MTDHINPNEGASPEGYCEGHDMRFPADEGCPLCPKPINPNEGRPEEVGASGAQQQNEQAFWVVLNRFAAHDPGCSAHDAGACYCGLDEALAGLKVLQTLQPQPARHELSIQWELNGAGPLDAQGVQEMVRALDAQAAEIAELKAARHAALQAEIVWRGRSDAQAAEIARHADVVKRHQDHNQRLTDLIAEKDRRNAALRGAIAEYERKLSSEAAWLHPEAADKLRQENAELRNTVKNSLSEIRRLHPENAALREALDAFGKQLEELAFKIPPPNEWTPQFVQLARAARSAALALKGTDDEN